MFYGIKPAKNSLGTMRESEFIADLLKANIIKLDSLMSAMADKRLLSRKDTFILGGFGAFIASLCCLSPFVLVLLGLSSVSVAGAFGLRFYFSYWWVFVASGILLMTAAYYVYLRKKHNICSIDDVKRHRTEILNTFLLLLVAFIVIYIIFEIILELVGIKLGFWDLEMLWSYLSTNK